MDPTLPQKAAEVASSAADAGWFRMLHVLGALAFLGGSLSAARLLGVLIRADEKVRAGAAALGRTVYLTLTLPAGLLLIGSGIYTVVTDPREVHYWKQGWWHVKFTMAILILVVDHLLVMKPLKALAKGGPDPRASEGLYRAGFWILGLLAFVLCLALFVLRK